MVSGRLAVGFILVASCCSVDIKDEADGTGVGNCPGDPAGTLERHPLAGNLSTKSISELEVFAGDPDLAVKAAAIFRQHGCCVIRGLNVGWVDSIARAIERTAAQSRRLEAAGNIDRIAEGWVTADGTLFIPGAWDGTDAVANRDLPVVELVKASGDDAASAPRRQIMVLAVDYLTSAALFQCATAPAILDVVEAIFDEPNIELFGNGQVVYKEPTGGHTVNPHQDSAFFEYGGSGLSPVGTLNYLQDTNLEINNGPLYVWPGSHRAGHINHTDTSSHLGLPHAQFPLDSGVVVEGNAGDTILFHQHMVHGSPPNHATAPRSTFINRYVKPDDPVLMPLATTAAGRAAALAKAAAGELGDRKRGYMLRGERRFAETEWDLGDKKDGQFH